MLDVVYEALAIGKATKVQCLPTMRTLRLALLDPGSKAALAG